MPRTKPKSKSKSKSISETANHNVLPEQTDQLSRGMYTDASIASMTPAHTSIESKVKAPPNSIIGKGIISNPLAPPRRSTRLNRHTGPSAPDLDSPSCPPSLRALKARALRTRATTCGVVKSSKVSKGSRVEKSAKSSKKISPTAIVSRLSNKMYKEIMKTHPAPAVLSQSTSNLNSPPSSMQRTTSNKLIFPQRIAIAAKITPARQPKISLKLSFGDLTVRTKFSDTQEE